MLMATIVLIVMSFDVVIGNSAENMITRSEAIVLLIFMCVFIYSLVSSALQSRKDTSSEESEKPKHSIPLSLVFTVGGLGGFGLGKLAKGLEKQKILENPNNDTYNPESPDTGKGEQDDDDLEELTINKPQYDLALTKFIIAISNDENIEDGEYLTANKKIGSKTNPYTVEQMLDTKLKNIYTLTILISVLYSTTDEFHQLFIVGRSGEIRDVLVDFMGSSIGIFIISSIYSLKNTPT